MHQLAVIGNPIAHSRSPIVWQALAQQCGIELAYTKLCPSLAAFEQRVSDFFAEGGLALSVTAPFKARAFAYANSHHPTTLAAATANHLFKTADGLIMAANTDGIGLVNDIKHLGFNLSGKNLLILGSGSVIFSVLSSLDAEHPARIDLLMRDAAKLEQFSLKSALIAEFDQNVNYDVVINTTPNQADNPLFAQVNKLTAGALVYDMNYTNPRTLFMQTLLACQPQLRLANGSGMLIQQALAAFKLIFSTSTTIEVAPLYSLFSCELP